MVAVIEKYFVIDETGLDVSYKRETDSTMLIINSPVVVKRQDGFKHRVGSKHKAGDQTSTTAAAESAKATEETIAASSAITAGIASAPEADKQAVGSN